MKILTIPIGADNFSYLIVCEISGKAAVVDPSESQPVLAVLQKEKLDLEWILCTHHHADHIEGIFDLKSSFLNIKIGGAAGDQARIPGLNQPFRDGDSLRVGQFSGQVIGTPGHTSGSVCYRFDNAIFTGDTLFGGGCGRLFEGTAPEMFHSLNTKLSAIANHDTQIYFGHEYTLSNLSFALAVEPENAAIQARFKKVSDDLKKNIFSTPSRWSEEHATNPFLRCTQPSVRSAAKKQQTRLAPSPVAVFRAIRDWKNRY